MTIRVALRHYTHYQFDRNVSLAPHILRLRPAVHCRTPIDAYSLRIEPKEHFINWQQDPFGNFLARLVFPQKCRELSVLVEVIADLTVINPFDFFVEHQAQQYPFSYTKELSRELVSYLDIHESGPKLHNWLRPFKKTNCSIIDFLVEINRAVFNTVNYNIRLEAGVQRCEETLDKQSGSCRDSAWLLVQALRHLGLAARFVSGYLVQLSSDIASLDGPSGPAKDFTDLHAWAEVYIPGAGWVGLDPTSGLLAGEGHIPLACTPSPPSAAPISGASDPCEVTLEFSNTVQRLHEDPRVTKPYSNKQWQAINALGDYVDTQLQLDDVRLTMGGEPTIVSIDDMQSPEWNTLADGANKRSLAQQLTKRLAATFAQGAIRHYGQGKWYPNEPLPRWQYGIFWRKDQTPIWRNSDLLAEIDKSYSMTIAHAKHFMLELAQYLAIHPRYICTAFEDTFYYLWQESQVPENINPLKAKLGDSLERRTLAQRLDANLSQPAGYALPIQWDYNAQCWRSGVWRFRRTELFLVPGNSPMGMRLPLSSLPWITPEDRDIYEPQSLFEDLPELGEYYGEVTRRYSHIQATEKGNPSQNTQENGDQSRHTIPHTALCVEVRDGRLCIFLPPMTQVEHYLDLVTAIEATAEKLKMPVILEGYEPPHDYRIERLLVTPDPGVIEVNIHPSHSWQELVSKTEILYEQARQVRLGTEKFMLDGRHTGTGGGNHITLGAATPSDSPLLRRPDLLRSLITYWQHHPGLSYLFSGMFIGPTSQAPRIDEGRDEKLYELEIAFQQIPPGQSAPPWLVDRLLRHLLTDITGNTHRAEFCIDKLYSPDSSAGRLGILELRAFEMPPHAKMSLVQALLLRSLIAWFWRNPYQKPLVRWGTGLHDRFLLPHYVKEDLKQVVSDLQRAGYLFELEWLEPFFEFRFPRYGTLQLKDFTLELRFAIEPWHVLGEEMGSQGTARYVDSSVERLQVKVSGFTEGRYIIACNGRRVPLRSTECNGDFVAGVRYRAWQPPSALHPTISPHVPLVFDIIDTWNDCAIGGCTYHVTHPGGRNYETFPINSFAAQARRIERFWDYGYTLYQTPIEKQIPTNQSSIHSGRRIEMHRSKIDSITLPPKEEANADYPHTLDLRYQI